MPANPGRRPNLNHLSIGKYHFIYLHHMLKASYPNISYGKGRADRIADTVYFNGHLIQRLLATRTHLKSLEDMIVFMAII